MPYKFNPFTGKFDIVEDISALETHVAGDGSDHADVASNTTHRGSDGSDHSKVTANETAIALNTTHRGSDGSDHSKVGANETAIALNTTHRGSDGSDHSKVGANETAIALNTTHRGSDGTTDHSQVATNKTHVDGDGSDHADVASNTAASHAESHSVASHSDTTATGAELEELTDGSETTLHSHAGANAVAFFRSQFAYSDADQITCEAAQYMCKDKYCYWVSTLTTGATGAAGGVDQWYLYLDYSAITSGVAITATELIWSTTEPTFNTTYRQWMNGDDRCIFTVRTDGDSNIREFFHDGDLVIFANYLTCLSNTDIDDTWTDVDIKMPVFYKALVTFEFQYVDASSVFYWRTNGQSGDTGHRMGWIEVGCTRGCVVTPVITDSTQKIEVKNSGSDGNKIAAYVNGWYLPRGM